MSDKIENRQTVDVKQVSDSIELTAGEDAPMALTRVVDQSKPTEPISAREPMIQLSNPTPAAGLEESGAPSQSGTPGKSRGLFRHKLVLASTLLVAITAFVVTGFDLSFLISSEGTIDRSFNFLGEGDDTPAVPNNFDYLEPDATKDLKLRPIHEGSAGGGKCGFVDPNGNVVIAPKFVAEKVFSEGLAPVRPTEEDRWGYIDTTGKLAIPALYNKANFFRHGYARVLTQVNGSGQAQLIDSAGRTVDLHGAEPVRDIQGFFVVHGANGGGYGLVKDGKSIIPCNYDAINKAAPTDGFEAYATDDGSATGGGPGWHESINKPYFKLLKNKKYGLADSNGKVLFESLYEDIKVVHNEHAVVVNDGLLGFCDFKGKLTVPAQYEQVTRFDDLIALRKDGKIKLIDSAGKPVKGPEITNIKIDSESYQWLHDGLGVFRRKNKYGYLDSHGREIIPAQYADAQAFDGGMARVRIGSRTIFIDKQGNRVDKTGYAYASFFKNGKAQVGKPGPLYDAIENAPHLIGRNDDTLDEISLSKGPGAIQTYTSRSNQEFEYDDSETE